MKHIEIKRIAAHKESTIGVLLIDGFPLCATLEQNWEDNKRNVSCIPTGTYKASVWHSPTRGDTIRLHDVPDRDSILVHVGNFPRDTKGCILPGMIFIDGREIVGQSRKAMDAIIQAVGNQPITVTITDHT